MKNRKNSKYSKEDFIAILSVATPKELNDIIEQRGKGPKKVPLIIKLSN